MTADRMTEEEVAVSLQWEWERPGMQAFGRRGVWFFSWRECGCCPVLSLNGNVVRDWTGFVTDAEIMAVAEEMDHLESREGQ